MRCPAAHRREPIDIARRCQAAVADWPLLKLSFDLVQPVDPTPIHSLSSLTMVAASIIWPAFSLYDYGDSF